MSSATFETSLTHQKRRVSWNWYNLFIYYDATRDNSKFKLFHQHPNFAYSKTLFAFASVAKSILTRLLIRWTLFNMIIPIIQIAV
jgi:hypothetical protein